MTTSDMSWLPDIGGAYLVLDTEVTHLSPSRGQILCLGLAHATRTPDLSRSFDVLVKTPYDPDVWGAVYHRLDFQEAMKAAGAPLTPAVRAAIDSNGGSCDGVESVPEQVRDARTDSGKRRFYVAYDAHQIPASRTLEMGMGREAALREVHAVLKDASAGGYWLVGHNILRFDLPYLAVEFARYNLALPEFQVLDTAAVVKASQMDMPPPAPADLRAFQCRILNTPRRIKYSLEDYCVPAYDLRRYGVDPSQQHKSPGYDCFVVSCLLAALFDKKETSACHSSTRRLSA